MKYLCLIYDEESLWERMPKDETDRIMGEFDKNQGEKPGFDKEQGDSYSDKPGFDKEQQQGGGKGEKEFGDKPGYEDKGGQQ